MDTKKPHPCGRGLRCVSYLGNSALKSSGNFFGGNVEHANFSKWRSVAVYNNGGTLHEFRNPKQRDKGSRVRETEFSPQGFFLFFHRRGPRFHCSPFVPPLGGNLNLGGGLNDTWNRSGERLTRRWRDSVLHLFFGPIFAGLLKRLS